MAEYRDRIDELNARERELILRYEETLDPYNSALAAGYSRDVARKCVYSWFRQPHLKPALYETAMARKAKRLEEHNVTAAELKHRTWLLCIADPNELARVEARCCRHCHGDGFGYQWKEHEFENAVAAYERDPKAKFPDWAGGMGFDQTKDPHADCPHCMGEGHKVTIVTDTRDLSEAGRALYKGTKVDRNGNIEVLMHDQEAARRFYAQLIGAVVDRKELTGKNGSPLMEMPTSITLVAQLEPVEPPADE
ncbi:hypothetical protein D3C77_48890 [compost metagenome]